MKDAGFNIAETHMLVYCDLLVNAGRHWKKQVDRSKIQYDIAFEYAGYLYLLYCLSCSELDSTLWC